MKPRPRRHASATARLARRGPLAAALLLAALPAAGLRAQDVEMLGRAHGTRPPAGYYRELSRNPSAYQFQRAWLEIARQVRERRQALAAAGDYSQLNSAFRGGRPSRAAAQMAGTAVSGTVRVPVLAGYFADSTQAITPDTATLRSTLWGTSSAPPYTITTYYDEISHGLITIQGDVIGWFRMDSTASWYEGSGNGLDPTTDHTGEFIKALLDSAEANGVNFSPYDANGDGQVDVVAILHPLKDGACGTSHLWSHRFVYQAWPASGGSPYSTNDGVTVNDYVLQSAVGGSSGCDSTQVMAIGTMSHELGHSFGLPDLYDTDNSDGLSAGIGVWGLMASGNYNRPKSPAHMSAWSKDQLGWIYVDTASSGSGAGDHTLPPIVSSDTALRVNISGTHEYFLLANRQGGGSDQYVPGKGLAIWHVDSAQLDMYRALNQVNAHNPMAVAMMQADGRSDLESRTNVGDGGDVWPGSSGSTTFGLTTTPSSELNDGSNSGLRIDSIRVNPDNSVSFRLGFDEVHEVVTTSVGSGTTVQVDGSAFSAPYSTIWSYPSAHTIAVDSVQGDTLTRHLYRSWSDAGARSHSVTADATPDSFVATFQTQHRLRATSSSGGSVSSSTALDGAGKTWIDAGGVDTLVATPADSGWQFTGWSGDTTAAADTLVLTMGKPYSVHAGFQRKSSLNRVTTSVGAGTNVVVDDTTRAAPYSASWTFASSHTVSVDSLQGDSLARYRFVSWNDGQGRTHTVVAALTPDTLIAQLASEYRLRATAGSGGSVSSSTGLDGTGSAWIAAGGVDTLVAAPGDTSYAFTGWSGDTTATSDTLVLTMSRAWTVTAGFAQPVMVATGALRDATLGADYADTLQASGGGGSPAWSLAAGSSLPAGLQLDSAGVVSGKPTSEGTFTFAVDVASGSFSDEDSVSLSVTRPSLTADQVAGELLGTTGSVSGTESQYLDFIGNRNGKLDVGDFRAFLQQTGVVPAVAAKTAGKGRIDR